MKHEHIVILALVALAVLIIPVGAVVYNALRIRATGTITVIGGTLYSDANLTVPATSIEWGLLAPGSQKQITLYLRSDSTSEASLSMFTEDYAPPEAINFLFLDWNLEGHLIQPQEVKTVLLTLTVSESIAGITDFGLDIVILTTAT